VRFFKIKGKLQLWHLWGSARVKMTCCFREFPYTSYKGVLHYLPLYQLSIWPYKMDISSVKHDLLQSSQWSYIILHIVTSTKYKCKYSPLLDIQTRCPVLTFKQLVIASSVIKEGRRVELWPREPCCYICMYKWKINNGKI
jgi:hypothetical protein